MLARWVSTQGPDSLLSIIQTDFSNCDRVLGANEAIDKQLRDLLFRTLKAGAVTEVVVAATNPSADRYQKPTPLQQT